MNAFRSILYLRLALSSRLHLYIQSLVLLDIMSDAVVSPQVNGTANGSLTNSHVNGTAAPKVKSSAAKSRGALKRLKAKQKGKGGNVSGADTASEAGTESDVEVSNVPRDSYHQNRP